jgi:hypothetical protein
MGAPERPAEYDSRLHRSRAIVIQKAAPAKQLSVSNIDNDVLPRPGPYPAAAGLRQDKPQKPNLFDARMTLTES